METLINQFHYISLKSVSSIKDMSILERKQWITVLKHYESEILNSLTDDLLTIDFFDTKFEEINEYCSELTIEHWKYKEKDLILIWSTEEFSFGGVFMEEKLLGHFIQSIYNLRYTKEGKEEFENEDQRYALEHIFSSVIDYGFCDDDHPHCILECGKR